MEKVTIQYGVYRTYKGKWAGIVKEGNRNWRSDGYVASHDAADALAGALQAAIEEGQRFTGDWDVMVIQVPGGVVASPWGR